MNETMKSILERRSIRSFKTDQITSDQLKQLLEAGLYAPSAMNQQPWHLTAIQKPDVIDRIVDTSRNAMLNSGNPQLIEWANEPNFHHFYHAPTVIVISGDVAKPAYAGDCGNAAQNICLAAYSLGLGSCYIASFLHGLDEKAMCEMKALLQLPEGYTPIFSVAIGYPEGEHPAPPERKKDSVTFIL